MAYSSLQQVLDAFPPALTAVGVGSFDISSTQVSSYYIYTSDGLIDGYLANRYTVPVTPVPAILTKISCDLSLFSMFRDKSMRIPDYMQARYDDAIKMLEKIADGKIIVPGGVEIESGDNFAFSTGRGYHAVFSPVLGELDQHEDADLVRAEQDKRRDDFGVSSF